MTDIIQLIAETHQGQAMHTINERLKDTVRAVGETGKKAVLTLKFTVTPRTQAMGGAVTSVDIAIDADVKRAQIPPGGAIFFVTEDGELSRDMPNQDSLFTEEKENTRG